MEKFAHPIQMAILLDDQSPVKSTRDETGEMILTPHLKKYILDCSQGLIVLMVATDKVVHALELLAAAMKPMRRSQFTHAEQIQFAIENYLIRSASVYERALIFTGQLLELGIADETISHVVVTTNDHVKRAQLVTPLKNLSKVCREYTSERNAIIHHRSYSETTFNQFSLIVSSNDLSRQTKRRPPFKKEVVQKLTKAILDEHVEDFEEHFEAIGKKLTQFLNAAHKVYNQRREAYFSMMPKP